MNRNYFKAACKCVSKDKTRPPLAGVYVKDNGDAEHGETEMVSTNGHVLIRVRVRENQSDKPPDTVIKKPFIVNAETCRIIASARDKENRLYLGNDEMIVGFMKAFTGTEDGQYPQYEKAIPQGQPHVFTLNAKYLQLICDAVRLCDGGPSFGIRFFSSGADKGVYWQAQTPEEGVKLDGVIMPMRDDVSEL